jgi:AcrR family transcriptional regulator
VPTPAKTSRDALIRIALDLVSSGGADALTIAAVALAAGVKGPSLYKHFADREALLEAVEIAVLDDIEAVLRQQIKGQTPAERLRSLAHVYRGFALAAPHRYGMMYRKRSSDDPALAAALLRSVQPLFEELEAAEVVPARVLPFARTLVAFIHGFVSMEIAEAFRLGGDVDAAFETGLETILRQVQN